jgi:hypothetical protein
MDISNMDKAQLCEALEKEERKSQSYKDNMQVFILLAILLFVSFVFAGL